MTGPARTVFLGSGDFAVPIAEAVLRHPSVEMIAAVTAPAGDGMGRRGHATPLAAWARRHGVSVLSPRRLREPGAVAELRELAPDLLVLADYGQIIPAELLALPPHGALNLHPSLLPRHRGASPIAAAIAGGDSVSGVSLMLMDAGLDTGPLIAQRAVALTGTETAPELEARLADEAARLLEATLADWLAGALRPVAQAAEGATLTRMLRREDGRLDPRAPAVVLERLVRAHQPWPGSFLETVTGRLTVWAARLLAKTPREVAPAAEPSAQPGILLVLDDGRRGGPGLALTTGEGLLELVKVQPAGGRRMTGSELLRGRPALAGTAVTIPPAAVQRQEG